MYSPAQPRTLYGHACETCDGEKTVAGGVCQTCQGDGEFQITSCPQVLVTPDLRAVIDGAEMIRRGVLPSGRGYLHEAHGFMQAVRYFWAQESAYRPPSDRD